MKYKPIPVHGDVTLSPAKRVHPTECSDDMTLPEVQQEKRKVPKRVIYFSDGVLEEYSTDEEAVEERKKVEALEEEKRKKESLVNPKTLAWLPWLIYHGWFAGSTVLSYADHLGEKLAWFFGITSPKYYYELEEFKKMQEEEEARKEKLDAEMHGWASKEEVDQVVETAPSGDAGI